MKEIAVKAINPQIFTIATLTGHAHLTVGEGYSIGVFLHVYFLISYFFT